MNPNQNSVQYLFGAFQFDPVERSLFKDGQVVAIPQKTLEVLLVLVEERGKVIEKEVLMNRLWPDQIVEEGNLTQHIYSLRKALGEDRNESRFIETVPRRGYRFIAEVTTVASQTLDAQTEAPAEGEKSVSGTERPLSTEEPRLSRTTVTNSEEGWMRRAGTRWESIREYRKPLLAVLSLFCFLSVLLALAKRQQKRTHGLSEITKLTYNGTVTTTAIAPDAMSLAYVTMDGDGNQAIWLKRLANRSELQLVPLSKKDYGTLSFSRDGNYLYYVEADNFVVPGTLYRYPLPGGPPMKLLEGKINRVFTISPDGEYVAYAHRSTIEGLSKLYVARVNGEGEPRVLAAKKMPNFLYAPAWSPDGKMIACVLNTPDDKGDLMTVVGYEAATGAEKAFTSEYWWRITDLIWLGDSRGLAMTAMENIAGQSQIWELSWPSGAATRLTSEFQNYGRISSSADGLHLLSIESKVLSNIWMVETEASAQTASRPRLEKLLSGDYIGMHGLSVTPDARVLYTSLEDGNWDIWSLAASGGRPLQLTKNTRSNYMQSPSPDGRYIVFSSNRGGRFNIWRIDPDGNNPQQLTNGPGEGYPRFSPDGAWLLYTQGEAPNRTLWRRNVDGGEPLKLAERVLPGPAISPDGSMVAYIAYEGHSGSIEIIPASGGAPLYRFAVDAQSIQWTTDGKAISYVREMKEAANIWNQPLAGGPPKQVTFFDLEFITHFSWFKDGKRLACVRFLPQNDVIQLSLQK